MVIDERVDVTLICNDFVWKKNPVVWFGGHFVFDSDMISK